MEEAAATTKTLNANGACRRGKLLWFPEQAVAAKMVVAVDVDEDLVNVVLEKHKRYPALRGRTKSIHR